MSFRISVKLILSMQDRAVCAALTLALFFLSPAAGIAQEANAVESAPCQVEFVIGDCLPTEGGDWDPAQSPLQEPFGVDFDPAGSMYIIELTSGRLHQRSAAGKLTTWRDVHPAGYSGDGGPVSAAQFNGPHNCVVTADDRLLIADSWNHCVRQIDLKTQRIETLAGTGAEGFSGDPGEGRAATFNFVMCIALDPSKQTLHLADLKNLRIRNLNLASGQLRTVAGNGQRGVPADGGVAIKNPLVDPRAVASDSVGNLYILERNGHALRVVRSDGTIHTVAGTGEKGFRDGPGGQAQFGSPKHICCDPDDNVYIADDLNGAVRKYDPQTRQVSTLLGQGFGDPKITLKHPHGVRWHAGWLYVLDTGQNRMLRVKVQPRF